MRSIKKFLNESDFEVYNLNDEEFVQFLKDNSTDISSGYRFYSGNASEEADITTDYVNLAGAKEIIMLKPAKGPETWIPLIVSVLISVAVSVITASRLENPSASNRSQSSTTNSFGNRENTQRLGERVDDPWGKVSAFVPSLIQLPYSIYVQNKQIENFAFAFMKKSLIENVKDGETDFNLIPGGKFNTWNPSSDLNSTPDFSIGGEINRPINSITESRELQAQELLPPNDLESANVTWRLSSSDGLTGVITVTNNPPDWRASDYYFTDDIIIFSDVNIKGPVTSTQEFWRPKGPTYPDVSKNFNIHDSPISLSSNGSTNYKYTVISANDTSVTIDLTDLPPSLQNIWNGLNEEPLVKYYSIDFPVPGFSFVHDPEIDEYTWFTDNTISTVVNIIDIPTFDPFVGKSFDERVGPIRIKKNTNRIILNFVAPNGFLNYYKNDERTFTAEIELLLEELDNDGNPTGNSSPYTFNFSTNSESKTKQSALTYYINNTLSNGSVKFINAQVTAKRITNRIKDDNWQNQDKVNWQNLYFEEYVNSPDNTDITIGQVQIPSSQTALRVKSRIVNFDVTPIFTPYQRGGTFGSEQPVSTFAETLIALALDKYNGRLNIDNIDAETYLDVQDEIREYYGFNEAADIGYNFDSTKIRFQEQYKLLCGALNINAYSQGGVFKAYADIKRNDSSKQFTHRYKIEGSDAKSRKYVNEYDGIEVTYRSNEDGKYKTVIKHVDGISSYNRKQLELSGCVNEKVATIRANRELNIVKNQRYSFSFDADGISRLSVIGERVDNVDYTRIVKRPDNMNNYAVYAGYVTDQFGLTIELSEPVYFTDGEEHSIRFADQKGNLMASIACSKGANANQVILAMAPEKPLYIGYKAERTSYTFASDSNRVSMPVIIKSIKAKEVKGVKARSISAIDFNEKYYTDDKEFSEI